MSERKPLTLEELRKMDGKPVLVESDSDYIPGGVYLCAWCDWKEEARLWSYEGENWFIGKYDKGVKVYAYAEPPRLDRSAWEPCEFCREREREVYKTEDYPGICDFEVMLDGPYEITVNAYNHYTPFTEDICFSFPVLFCPKCGRPLTEEAWAMLEKRLEV